MKRICSIMRILSIICLAFFALIYIAFAFVCLTSSEGGSALGALVYVILHGLTVCAVFLLAILGLTDVVRGHSPFTAKQARRLMIAGCVFLAIAIIELAFPVDLSIELASSTSDLIELDATTSSASNVGVAALLFSFASFCLSAIFKYGIILQKLSDETV